MNQTKPSFESRPIHNHEWANWMEYVGLIPSHTGELGGKRTRDRMSHYIVHGAEYACDQLMST